MILRIFDNIFSRKYFISFAVLYCCFKSYPHIPYTKYTTFLLVAYGCLFFVYRAIRNKRNLLFADMLFAYSYFAISIISFVVNGMKMEQGLYKVIVELFSIFCALFLYMPRNIDDTNEDLKNDFDFLMKFLLCACFVIGLLNIASMFFPKSFTIDEGNPIGFAGERFLSRFNGLLGNANRLGQFAISSIPASIYVIYIYINKIDNNKKLYFIALINLFIQLLSCIMSGSRATYINLFLYLLLFLYLIYKSSNEKVKKYRKKLIVFSILSITLCLIFYIAIRGVRFKISDRIGLYIIALNMFLHNNVFLGSSIGRCNEAWAESMKDLISKNDFYQQFSIYAFYPHNTYLTALCLHGILGFMIIVSLFLYTLYRIVKLLIFIFESKDDTYKIIIIILAAYFINAIMGTLSDGLVLTNNLWMINNLLSMVSIGFIAQFYRNIFLVKKYE